MSETNSIKDLIVEEDVNVNVGDSLLVGPDGPVGPEGPQGPEGKSAYEVAVENGFEGTEEDWLASLKATLDPDSVGTDELKDRSVTPEKTDFARKIHANEIDLSENWYLNKLRNTSIGSDANLIDNNGYISIDIIEIPEKISIKSTSNFYVYFLDENKKLLSYINSGWSNFILENIEIPSNSSYYSVSFFVNNIVDDEEKVQLWNERVNNNNIAISYVESFDEVNFDLQGKIEIPDLYIQDLDLCKENIDNIKSYLQNKLITEKGSMYYLDFISVSNTSTILDTNIKKYQNSTSRVTFNNSGTSLVKFISEKEINFSQSITLCFYIDHKSYTNLNSLNIYIGENLNDSNYSTASKRQLWKSLFKSGWNFVKILKNNFSNNANLNSFNSIYIEGIASSTIETENFNFATINFDSIIVDMKIKPIVLLCFDGLIQNNIDNGLYDYIFAKNLPFTIFGRNYDEYDSNISEVLEIGSQQYRWELGLYGSYGSNNNVIQNGTDYKIIKENIESNQNTLINAFNKKAKSYACSQGVINPLILSACLDNNINFIRGGSEQYIDMVDKDIHQINYFLIDNSDSLSSMKEYIDNIINYGRIVCLITHGTTENGQSSLYAKDADYKALLDYIYDKRKSGEIEVLTFEEFYKEYVDNPF